MDNIENLGSPKKHLKNKFLNGQDYLDLDNESVNIYD